MEYFNPFRNVQIDPSVNLEELARVAHALGEAVGLGLRNLANCPVEMNLMPESTLRWRTFNEKKPYFIATVFSLVAVAFAVGFLFEKQAISKETELEKLQPEVQQLQDRADAFNRVYTKVGSTRKEADQIATWMSDRHYWGDVLAELRQVLIRAENGVQKKLAAQRAGVQAGIWIEQLITTGPTGFVPNAAGAPGNYNNGLPGGPGGMPGNQMNTPQIQTPQTTHSGAISLICRAVSLSKVDSAANSDIAYTLENELQASPLFDPKATQLTGQINAEDASGTFTFGISAVLKNPLNL